MTAETSAATGQPPPVAIGMPIYNEERFLERSLEALRAQDYANIRILISDNASTDGTRDICERAAAADERISYFRMPENIGVAANFRSVLEKADGKYFMWAAGHDEWSTNLVSDSVAVLEANETASLAFANSHWIDEHGARDDRDTDYPDTRGMSLFRRFFTVFWGNMHPVLGVIRLAHLRRSGSIQNFAGADLVLLSELVLMGDFVHAPNAGWKRRDVRSKENHSERLQRYTGEEHGHATTTLDKRFPLLKLPFALIATVCRARVPLQQRAALLLALLPLLPLRYIVGRRQANRKGR